jgi:hypothetical protein
MAQALSPRTSSESSILATVLAGIIPILVAFAPNGD